MSRMKFACAVAGASLAAGAVGAAAALLFAPASGAEVRRRLTWYARDEWRHASRACESMIDRAASHAKAHVVTRGRERTDGLRRALTDVVACGDRSHA